MAGCDGTRALSCLLFIFVVGYKIWSALKRKNKAILWMLCQTQQVMDVATVREHKARPDLQAAGRW